MTFQKNSLVFCILMLTLFFSGCVTETGARSYPNEGLSLDQICNKSSSNETIWIAINPVSDKYIGDIFRISAKTNLSIGTKVLAQTFPFSYNPVNRTDARGRLGTSEHLTVTEGNNGVNTISFDVDSKEFRSEPYLVLFIKDTDTKNPERVTACTWYNVSAAPTQQITTNPASTPSESAVHQQKKSSAFISIDPGPHYYVGDMVTFMGLTSVQPGESIMIAIRGSFSMCSKGVIRVDSVDYCHGRFNRTIVVRDGTDGRNLWTFSVNTSEHDFTADNYMIEVRSRDGSVENISLFTLHAIPQPNITLVFPENVPGMYALRFSGQVNTGNGANEHLVLIVSSDNGKKVNLTIPVYWNGSGYAWNVTVNKSALFPYNFYVVNLSSQDSPQIHLVRRFQYNNEPAWYPYSSISPPTNDHL